MPPVFPLVILLLTRKHTAPDPCHTEMTDAAGEAGKPMILINPKLGDIQSGERGG